jgi:hypothetical protein
MLGMGWILIIVNVMCKVQVSRIVVFCIREPGDTSNDDIVKSMVPIILKFLLKLNIFKVFFIVFGLLAVLLLVHDSSCLTTNVIFQAVYLIDIVFCAAWHGLILPQFFILNGCL